MINYVCFRMKKFIPQAAMKSLVSLNVTRNIMSMNIKSMNIFSMFDIC